MKNIILFVVAISLILLAGCVQKVDTSNLSSEVTTSKNSENKKSPSSSRVPQQSTNSTESVTSAAGSKTPIPKTTSPSKTPLPKITSSSQKSTSKTISSKPPSNSPEVSSNDKVNQKYTISFSVFGTVIKSAKLSPGEYIIQPQYPDYPTYCWDKEVPVYMPAENLSFSATAESGTYGTQDSWTFYFNGKLQVFGSGTPDFKSDTQPWNKYKDRITSVYIAPTLTQIGNYSFFGCTNITSVEIPDSVSRLGDCVFLGCDKLQNVTIGANLKSIGQNAFSTVSLTSVRFNAPKMWFATETPPQGTKTVYSVTITGDTSHNANKMIQHMNCAWSIYAYQ